MYIVFFFLTHPSPTKTHGGGGPLFPYTSQMHQDMLVL